MVGPAVAWFFFIAIPAVRWKSSAAVALGWPYRERGVSLNVRPPNQLIIRY